MKTYFIDVDMKYISDKRFDILSRVLTILLRNVDKSLEIKVSEEKGSRLQFQLIENEKNESS